MTQITQSGVIASTRTYSYALEKLSPETHLLSNLFDFSRFFFSGPETQAHQVAGIHAGTDKLYPIPFLYLLMTCLSPLPTPICSVALQFLVQGFSLIEQMDST